jgi:hypothetical protein
VYASNKLFLNRSPAASLHTAAQGFEIQSHHPPHSLPAGKAPQSPFALRSAPGNASCNTQAQNSWIHFGELSPETYRAARKGRDLQNHSIRVGLDTHPGDNPGGSVAVGCGEVRRIRFANRRSGYGAGHGGPCSARQSPAVPRRGWPRSALGSSGSPRPWGFRGG